MKYQVERKLKNEQSRNSAQHDGELWSEVEVELLEENWSTEPLEDIAAVLGRTVEACRQKHYELAKVPSRVVKAKEVNNWTRGFTSLEEMGF